MEQLLFTPFHQQLFPPLIAMLKTSFYHSFWIVFNQENEWTLFGIHIRRTVSRIQQERREVRVREERWHQDSSKLESISSRQYQQERTLCPPDQQSFKLPVSREQGSKHYLRRICTDKQGCDHEEADTRIGVRVQHALSKGCSQVFVRTVDTDVLVIMIRIFHDLIALYPSATIWIGLGMGKYVNTSVWMPPTHFLALKRLGHSLCSIHSLDATRPPVSLARVRSPPGTHGSHSLTWQRH